MPRLTSVADKSMRPQIGVYSFGTVAQGSTGQFEYDVTQFRDPGGQKQFEGMNGTYPKVKQWMLQDRRVPIIIEDCLLLADDLVRAKQIDSNMTKSVSTWLSFAFKDFHGKWTAPAVAELVADALSDAGYVVVVYHASVPSEKVWQTQTT